MLRGRFTPPSRRDRAPSIDDDAARSRASRGPVLALNRWRWAAFLLPVFLGASFMEPAVAVAMPATAPPVTTPKAGAAVTQAADVASAMVAARLAGHRVEALGERTETTTTWVNPNGSLTSEVGAGPVRFKRSGAWTDIDVSMVKAADGSVMSKAHPNNLRLSGGGGTTATSLKAAAVQADQTLVSLGSGSTLVSLGWKGGLPEPVLEDATATYKNVVPGADLVIEATRSGFEQYLVLNRRPSGDTAEFTLPLSVKGLTVKAGADDSVAFVDAKGDTRATMPAPDMWDASSLSESGIPSKRTPVAMDVVRKGSGADLVLRPDPKFLAAATYPVTVDPSTETMGVVFDTYITSPDTGDRSGQTTLRWGTDPANTAAGPGQTFLTFQAEAFANALVSDAKLSLWNIESGNGADCLGKRWQVFAADKGATTASRWATRPLAVGSAYGTSTETKGSPTCSSDNGWISTSLTTLGQSWASAKAKTGSVVIKAGTEANTAFYKVVRSANFSSGNPKLVVTYNYRPKTGTDRQAGPPFVKDSSGVWWVNTLTPVLRDTVVDANSDQVRVTFQVFDASTGAQTGVEGSYFRSGWVPSGKPAPATVPTGLLTNGGKYKFRTSPLDSTSYNTGWSPYTSFSVDTTPPNASATITSTDYPTGSWVKGAKQAGTFTVTPPTSEHNAVEWSLDGATWTPVATTNATPVSFRVRPSVAGVNTLQVRTSDRAANKSDITNYTFNVGAGAVSAPEDGTRTPARVPLAAQGDSAKYGGVTFSWRRSEADSWATVPALDVTDAGEAVTWPVALTDGKTPALVWNATSTVELDGSVQVRAEYTGATSTSSEPVTIVVDRAADGAATESIGPGSVNLLTGDYTISATDFNAYGISVSRTASSRSPDAGTARSGQASIFGSEWVSGTAAETSGSGFTQVVKVTSTAVRVEAADGQAFSFTANAGQTGWTSEPGSEDLTLTGSLTNGDFTLKDTDGAVTTFTKPANGAATWTVSSVYEDGIANSATRMVSEMVTMGTEILARPKRIITPTSAVTTATCQATPSTPGCRVIDFAYATATTATGDSFGDYTGRLMSVSLWSTTAAATAATSIVTVRYAYDAFGRLRQQWDPRVTPTLTTAYSYDAAGRVATVTPPGELPWSFAYGSTGTSPAAGAGMLLSLSRPTLTPGSSDATNGTAKISLVYSVPITGAKAPKDISAKTARVWGQSDVPTDATAIFGPETLPSSSDGAELEPRDYALANIAYLDSSARQVNSVTPGGHTGLTEYDGFGNTVRTMSAANLELATSADAVSVAAQTRLGINHLPTAERAQLLSDVTSFDDTGTRELQSLNPLHEVMLEADAKSGAVTLAPASTVVLARTLTLNEYDSGRPTNGTATVSDQITKSTSGAQMRLAPEVMVEPRVKTAAFDWVKGLPTSQTTDPGGLAITTTTTYDDQGRASKTTLPKSSGGDAGTTIITYYSGTGTGTCNGHPEWADAICQTGPAGAITGGGTSPSALPTATTTYDRWGNVASISETANAVTRTVTITYDEASRPVGKSVTGGIGTAVPSTRTTYDSRTGKAVKATSGDGTSIEKGYDDLGRQTSYTDTDGKVTRATFDTQDRPATVTDSIPSTTTYTYDTEIDPRGLLTSFTDSIAGNQTARYDADGVLITAGLPGGYTLTLDKDPTGQVSSRTYSRNSDELTAVSNTVFRNIHGQVVSDTGTPGVTSSFAYGYDQASRLVRSRRQNTDGTCTVKAYGFDKNSNRTALASATSTSVAAGGQEEDEACPTDLATMTSTFDSADRITDGSVYDAFGRATSTPAINSAVEASSQTYYANDLARSQTTGINRTTWSLDAGGRSRVATMESNSTGTWATTAVKTNHYDSTEDRPRWISENASETAITRYVDGIDGSLGASTTAVGSTILHMSDIHGDTVLLLPLDTASAPRALDTDEYGNPTTATSNAGSRYTWLGGRQRSTETPTGMTLMGVRFYNSATGRFLSIDPVSGGNDNSYTYPTDPVNMSDLAGRARKCWLARGETRGCNTHWGLYYDTGWRFQSLLNVSVDSFWEDTLDWLTGCFVCVYEKVHYRRHSRTMALFRWKYVRTTKHGTRQYVDRYKIIYEVRSRLEVQYRIRWTSIRYSIHWRWRLVRYAVSYRNNNPVG
jgi:RHS repeat-associated protein